MEDLSKILKDLKNSEKGSIDEKVYIDIVLNMESFRNDINAVRAFCGFTPKRDNVIAFLEAYELNRKKEEVHVTKTVPGYLNKIKIALQNLKKK